MANNPKATENIIKFQFKKGQSGNPKGLPKGTRNLQSIIKDMLEDGKLDWKKVPTKYNADIGKTYGKRGWEAIVYVAVAQAVNGERHAREWLRKSQYGDKLDITSGGLPMEAVQVAGFTIKKKAVVKRKPKVTKKAEKKSATKKKTTVKKAEKISAIKKKAKK